jgi:acyl-CoA thioester hydrolase
MPNNGQLTTDNGQRTNVPAFTDVAKIKMMTQNTIEIRVRYPEVDAMGYLHHSRYLQYFEIGRVELLRQAGFSYADLEKAGVFFVVIKAEIKYKAPARYDEILQLVTRVTKQTFVRYDHAYQLRRDGVLLAEGATSIACVGRDGQVMKIPENLATAGQEP